MLQVSTGKFYETTDQEKLYVTIHQGILYTNYSPFCDKITTCLGNLLPSESSENIQSIVCEVTERLPKPDRDPQPGDMISAGGHMTMLQDFAALISFGINATFTLDRDLTRD